ncbi:MAG: hypothetical protein ACJ74J_01260 [Blastocatellia bacterium]
MDLTIRIFNDGDYNNELDALHGISYNFLVLVFEQPADAEQVLAVAQPGQ